LEKKYINITDAIKKSNKNLFENNLVARILFLCDDLKHKEKNAEFILRYLRFRFKINL